MYLLTCDVASSTRPLFQLLPTRSVGGCVTPVCLMDVTFIAGLEMDGLEITPLGPHLKVALVAAHLNAAVVPIRSSGPAFPVKPAVIQHATQVFGANNVARFLQNVELTTAVNDLINFEEFTVSPALREGTSIVFLPPASHTYVWPSPRIHERE